MISQKYRHKHYLWFLRSGASWAEIKRRVDVVRMHKQRHPDL